MELSLFDWHCDTAYEMQRQRQALECNTLAVSLESAKHFLHYIQVMALWTPPQYSDGEGWNHVFTVLSGLQNDAALLDGKATIRYPLSGPSTVPQLLLSIEDARILCGDAFRVDALFDAGIRILTPLWRGESCIGGSHDTNVGLTAFGKHALQRALERGMLLDISHASEASAEGIFSLASEYSAPVIASHSNAYECCPVSRNLRSEQIKNILSCGGIIGVNLHAPFLSSDGNANVDDILRHIEYFMAQGAEHSLCLGCDFDGGNPPSDIPSLAFLPRLAERMQQCNYSDELIHAVFFENACSFARKYIKSEPKTEEGS